MKISTTVLNKTYKALGVLGVLVLLVLALSLPSLVSRPASAAPFMIPTPVASVNLSGPGRIVQIFPTEAITQDTTHCVPSASFNTIDTQYVVDVGTVNTTTLTLRYSNNATTFETGPNIASALVADGNGLAQYASFGAYACILANVVNTNTITVTVVGVGK